ALTMTGTTRSSGGLDDRRKRLLFRCWHRGTREMDLILGRFAAAEIANLSDDELGTLERLIEVPDPDLYAALTGDAPLPPELARSLEFFAPDLPVMQFPAWDCQPYDRVSPHGGVLAQRLTTLAKLSRLTGSDKPLIVLTTVNAVTQRVPSRDMIAAQALSVA